jgi:serine/threonine-protein kinase
VTAPDPLALVTIAERYRVVRKIAEGGMGAVYEAEQLALGRKVAIKVLHGHLASDEEITRRFEREARATTAIGHPNIVEVIDFGALTDGARYLVLEYLDGRDLGRALRETGPFSLGRAARVAMQIADGASAAHEKGIVHRDLKPENAIVLGEGTASERVKIVDFGISKFRDAAMDESARTRTGTALGTPYFMAPEQAQGKRDVDARADVYSLGAILFRLLSGHHPFDDASYPMLIVKICTEEAPSLAKWRTDLPREIVELVAKMLSKDPIARPQSMAIVKEALAPFADDTRTPALTGAKGTASTEARVLSKDALARTHAQDEDDDAIEERHATLRSLGVTGGDMATTGSVGTPLKIVIGVMAAAAAGLGAWALFGAHEPAVPHDDEVNAALPTPSAPTTLALTAASYGTDSWSWLNPRPRAMPTWFAVDVAADGAMAMVGEHGAAAHTVTGSMFTWRTGTDASLEAVRFTGEGQALAAGANGALVRLTESGPHPLDSGVTTDLHAIAVVSPTETVIAGDGGLVVRLVGERATRLDLGVQDDFLGAHARRGEAWLAGANGTIVHVTDLAAGHFVREHGPTDDTLRAIGGCERGSLYAVGDDGTIARRHADGSWHGLRLDIDTHETFTSVGCDRGRAAIVGASGLVVLASGDRTVRLASGYDGTWHGTAGAGESTWLVGGGGQIATIDSDHVVTRMDGPSVQLRDVATIGGAVVAVGEWGHIVRETANGFALATESPTDAGLGALATIDDSRLVAVGDLGAMVEIGPEHATLVTSGTRVSLHDVVSANAQLLVVGNEGTLLRGAIESLAASRIADVGDLWAVAGAPSDAIVVGDGGFVAHVDGTSHQTIACAGVSASLRAVVREGATSWAVGEHGTIVRVDASGCSAETITGASPTLPTLNAIAIGPHGRPFAVGDEGSSFERAADGTWAATDLDGGRSSLRGVERIDAYVYVVGTGGTILRHIVVDGS